MKIDFDIKFENYSPTGSTTAPVIFKDKNSMVFAPSIIGVPSVSQTLTVSGFNLTSNLLIVADPDWIINNDNSNVNQSPINLVPTGGTVSSTLIYCKHIPSGAGPQSGDITLSATGATTRTVSLSGSGVVDVPPTYTVPAITIATTIPVIGEIGESFSAIINMQFFQNDAGAPTRVRIMKDGIEAISANGPDSLVFTDSGVFDIVPIDFEARADYLAGPLKNYSPSGTVDARPAAIRNPIAPQAAENDFASSLLTLIGELYIFYGPSVPAPSNSSMVRALPYRKSTTDATNSVFTFLAGSSALGLNISVCVPPGVSVVNIRDLSASGTTVLPNFTLTTFTVLDAAGNPNTYDNYTWTLTSYFTTPHLFEIILI